MSGYSQGLKDLKWILAGNKPRVLYGQWDNDHPLGKLFRFRYEGDIMSIGARGGVGKTKLTDAFLLECYLRTLKEVNTATAIPYNVYFSMERSIKRKMWHMALYIYYRLSGHLHSIDELNSGKGLTKKLINDIDNTAGPLMKLLEEKYLSIYQGRKSPQQIYDLCVEEFKENIGEVIIGKRNTVTNRYEGKENIIPVFWVDHTLKLRSENGLDLVSTIGEFADLMAELRDGLHYSGVIVSQLTQAATNASRSDGMSTIIETDFFGGARFQAALDVMVGLVQPRFGKGELNEEVEHLGFQLDDLTSISPEGIRFLRYRMIKCIKSNEGAVKGLSEAMRFLGEVGFFEPFAKSPSEYTPVEYKALTDGVHTAVMEEWLQEWEESAENFQGLLNEVAEKAQERSNKLTEKIDKAIEEKKKEDPPAENIKIEEDLDGDDAEIPW